MKNKILRICTLLLMLISLFCFVGCDCASDSSFYDDNGVSIGGQQGGQTEVIEQIFNADDIHLSLGADKDAIINQSYVVIAGVKTSADINIDKVKFGVQGVYDIVYSYGDLTANRKLYIYGAPTISGASTFSVDYKEAIVSCSGDIVAKDSFGNVLDVLVLENGGMLNEDYSVNVGTFKVTFIAYDKAGQSVTCNSRVTIKSNKVPEVLDIYSFDVADGEFAITLDEHDFDNFAYFSINNAVVPNEFVTDDVDGNRKIIDTDYVLSSAIGDELLDEMGEKVVSFKIVTYDGLAKSDLVVSDKKPVQCDLTELLGFFDNKVKSNTELEYPKINYLNAYQNVTPTISFANATANLNSYDYKVNFEESGEWVLTIKLRGETLVKNVIVYNDLGFSDGMVITPSKKLSKQLYSGYTVNTLYVKELETNKLVARYKANTASTLDGFDSTVLSLNKSKRYVLDAKVEKGGKTYEQNVQFTVATADTLTLLGGENDYNVSLNNPKNVGVNYKNVTVGNISGSYYWNPKVSGVVEDDTRILFDKEKIANFGAGSYLSFKVRCSGALSLVIAVEPRTSEKFYLWGSFRYGDKCAGRLNFYDMQGNLIDVNSVDPLRQSGYSANTWVQVEFLLPEGIKDFGELRIYNDKNVVNSIYNNVYLADLKISNASIMNDSTVNKEVQYYFDSDVSFEDKWN